MKTNLYPHHFSEDQLLEYWKHYCSNSYHIYSLFNLSHWSYIYQPCLFMICYQFFPMSNSASLTSLCLLLTLIRWCSYQLLKIWAFCVFSLRGCFHFTEEMHTFRVFFFFGPVKRQNLEALPSQCGRPCHFQHCRLILQPPPKALSGDVVISLWNYTGWFKNRLQGFPRLGMLSGCPLLTVTSTSLLWYKLQHFNLYLKKCSA